MAPETQSIDLSVSARKYRLTPSTILGLGAGLYFEYLRSSHLSPSHFITGLHRNLEQTLDESVSNYQTDPASTLRVALRENALWFNLDRAPTTGLLGMEMLAEELPQFDSIVDGNKCVLEMARTIRESRGLYRQTYADFLSECSLILPATENLAQALKEIGLEWNAFADRLAHTANDPFRLERAGRLLRRLAIREEHFWGSVLEL